MRKLIIISALALSFKIQAQYYYPHPKKFTQTQIDMMSDSYLNGLRRAYPDYIIRRSNVGPKVDHNLERVFVIHGYPVFSKDFKSDEKRKYIEVEELNESYRKKYHIKQKYAVKLKNGKYKYLEESELKLIESGDLEQIDSNILLTTYQ